MSEGARTLPQYVAVASVCLGSYSMGTVLAWTSNISDYLKAGKLNGLEMSNVQLGWTGSCCTIGSMLASFPAGYMADAIGRKPTCLAMVVPFTLGWLMIMFSQNCLMVYFGRALTGAAGGTFVVVGPVYAAEVAQTHIRGKLGSFVQLFIAIGSLHSGILGWALPLTAYILSCMIIPLLFGVFFIFQPETPYYNMRKGKPEMAEKSLRRLRGENYDLEKELALITHEIEIDKMRGSFFADITTKANKKAMIITFLFMFYRQMGGVNAITFYSKLLLIESETSFHDELAVVLMTASAAGTTLVSTSLVEKSGRILLLVSSFALCACSTFTLGFYFSVKYHFNLPEILKYIGFFPALSLIGFAIGFNLGLGPVTWMISAEICSPAVKQIIGSIGCSINWGTAFMVTRFCLTVQEAIGIDFTFYIFSSVSLSGILFVYLLVPETKQKRYDKIKEELEEKWFKCSF